MKARPGDWRQVFAMKHLQYAFVNDYYALNINAWQAGTAFHFDLNSGGHIGYNLFQERPTGPILNKRNLSPSMFTPEAARNAGT